MTQSLGTTSDRALEVKFHMPMTDAVEIESTSAKPVPVAFGDPPPALEKGPLAKLTAVPTRVRKPEQIKPKEGRTYMTPKQMPGGGIAIIECDDNPSDGADGSISRDTYLVAAKDLGELGRILGWSRETPQGFKAEEVHGALERYRKSPPAVSDILRDNRIPFDHSYEKFVPQARLVVGKPLTEFYAKYNGGIHGRSVTVARDHEGDVIVRRSDSNGEFADRTYLYTVAAKHVSYLARYLECDEEDVPMALASHSATCAYDAVTESGVPFTPG